MLVWQRSHLGWEQGKLLQGQMQNKFSVAVKLSSLTGGKEISYCGQQGLYWSMELRKSRAVLGKAPWARRTKICIGFTGRVVGGACGVW